MTTDNQHLKITCEYTCGSCGEIFEVIFFHNDPVEKIVICKKCLKPQVARVNLLEPALLNLVLSITIDTEYYEKFRPRIVR